MVGRFFILSFNYSFTSPSLPVSVRRTPKIGCGGAKQWGQEQSGVLSKVAGVAQGSGGAQRRPPANWVKSIRLPRDSETPGETCRSHVTGPHRAGWCGGGALSDSQPSLTPSQLLEHSLLSRRAPSSPPLFLLSFPKETELGIPSNSLATGLPPSSAAWTPGSTGGGWVRRP